MLAIVDVQYFEDRARAACVLAQSWASSEPERAWTVEVSPIAAYEPGRFYLRELPCLLAVLKDAPALEQIVIDGYVWLDEAHRPERTSSRHSRARCPSWASRRLRSVAHRWRWQFSGRAANARCS